MAFGCYLIVPLLIPVLTTYGLPLGYMGDILGGGFVLALAGFSVALAGTESGAPYAQLGGSRAMTFGALIEPTILFVIFAVALITSTDLPYALAATVRSSSAEIVPPRARAGGCGLLLGGPRRHRTDPRRDTFGDARVRDDRRGADTRALGSAARALEVGIDDEAVDPLHDPDQRLLGPVGSGGVGSAAIGAPCHPVVARQGRSSSGWSSR